ncbi:MAG: hypothetical protein AAF518_10860 [Spirochaetota bacterium]
MSNVVFRTINVNLPPVKDQQGSFTGTTQISGENIISVDGCLKGWQIQYTDTGRAMTFVNAFIKIQSVTFSGHTVTYSVIYGLQDEGGTFDWQYQGECDILLIVATASN